MQKNHRSKQESDFQTAQKTHLMWLLFRKTSVTNVTSQLTKSHLLENTVEHWEEVSSDVTPQPKLEEQSQVRVTQGRALAVGVEEKGKWHWNDPEVASGLGQTAAQHQKEKRDVCKHPAQQQEHSPARRTVEGVSWEEVKRRSNICEYL